jgi:4-hydroxy-3-polyprenylbenzoate decarboxylase
MSEPARIVVGITGASGALYAVRTVRALLLAGCEVDLVVSTFGVRLLRDEAGLDLAEETCGIPPGRRTSRASPAGSCYEEQDLGAAISSDPIRRAAVVVP